MTDQPTPPEESPTVIESPEPVHSHHSTGIRWFDAAITLSVLMVSVASLVIALHSGSTMERLVDENARLVRANSTPLLSFRTSNAGEDGKPELTFSVSNYGSGPARLVWFELHGDGKTYPNIIGMAQSVSGALTHIGSSSQPLAHTVLRTGEERPFLLWPKPADDAGPEGTAWKAVESARWHFKAEACYCSLLNECWHSTLDGDVPTPVERCDAAGHASFGEMTASLPPMPPAK